MFLKDKESTALTLYDYIVLHARRIVKHLFVVIEFVIPKPYLNGSAQSRNCIFNCRNSSQHSK